MQTLTRTALDDAITIIASTEKPREDFWLAWKLVKNACKNYGLYTSEVRGELFVIRDLVLVNNDVTTASYRLAKLADKLSKFLREQERKV